MSQTLRERRALHRLHRSEEVLSIADAAREAGCADTGKVFRVVRWGRVVLIAAAIVAVVAAILWS